jgi:hypothetical protein
LPQKLDDGLLLESPQFTGRVIAALYVSEERMPLSGEAPIGTELLEYLGGVRYRMFASRRPIDKPWRTLHEFHKP